MPQKDIQELTKRYSGNVAKLLTLGRPVVNPHLAKLLKECDNPIVLAKAAGSIKNGTPH